MKDASQTKRLKRKVRQRRVRSRVSGTATRPRLTVFRSSRYVYAQLIDDRRGRTLAAASNLGAGRGQAVGKVASARLVGELLARQAKEQKIERVCFDRGGYIYTGRVRAVAEGARAGGLQF